MDRRYVKTEKAIRSAYFSLLLEESNKITIAEIARMADIDRKTFYLHYQSLDDIVVRYAEEKLEELKGMLKQRGFFAEPYNLETLFYCLNRLALKDIELYRRLSKDPSYDFFWQTLHDMIRDTVFSVYIEPGQDESGRLQTYIDFYTSGIIAVYRRWLEIENDISMDELSHYLSRFTDSAVRIFKKIPDE
ncbi:MAG: TetR/AcrR family transcriptional regulator [Erysipelotrichaceae bacterium]|nr:TetR/AcrR family transcriptional regulator [Erysipelotrichaceae bacterium]